jgi:hypothetical protein
MESFLGSGDLYLDRLTEAGVSQGAKIAGACSKFALQTESEIKEQSGKGRENYGQVIAAATLPGKTNIKVTLDQLDAENLAVAFLGTAAAGSQAAGTIEVGTPVEVEAIHDRYVEIGKEALSAVVVKDETGATTYVVGEDYVLNARLGLIKALSTGDIVDGATIKISGSYGLVNYEKIQGGAAPIIRAKLLLDGKNYVNGRNCKVVVKLARLKPSTEVDFLSGDFLPLELEGVCEIPEGDTTAFDIIYYE